MIRTPHRLVLRLLAALGAAVACAPALATVVMYEHDNFQGRSTTIVTRMTNLGSANFNDTASSIVVNTGWWQFCQHADFGGDCITLGPGRYASLNAQGMNDRISSVRPVMQPVVPGGAGIAAIDLYEHNAQNGRSYRASAPVRDLQRENFNDTASSVVVRSGRWELCTDAEFTGRCVVVGPGTYPDLNAWGMNDAISSLRPTNAPLTPGIMSVGMPAPNAPPPRSMDNSQAPEITFSINGTSRVTFPGNPCVVFFGRGGQRLQTLPQCDAAQVSMADDLTTRFRNEYGMASRDGGGAWAAWREQGGMGGAGGGMMGNPNAAGERLQITIETNREGEARFGNGCVVNFNGFGRRTNQSSACNADQVRRAEDEMAAARRAGGM